MPLEWRGELVLAEVLAASKAAVDATLQQAADYARVNHDWQSESGEAEAEIFVEDAHVDSDGMVVGAFGDDSGHALYLEVGTVHMPARPFLRPALDAVDKNLAGEIKAGLGG
jgi:HK97 gp10 family phage protein